MPGLRYADDPTLRLPLLQTQIQNRKRPNDLVLRAMMPRSPVGCHASRLAGTAGSRPSVEIGCPVGGDASDQEAEARGGEPDGWHS